MTAIQQDQGGQEPVWFVYILECRDGSFYTSVTDDLERGLARHNAGAASRYTRSRRPVQLCYYEHCASRVSALIRACALRLLSREEKAALIKKFAEGQTR